MRLMTTTFVALAAGCLLANGLWADDKPAAGKEVTLKGTILCAKCALHEKGVTKCTTAIKVQENGKDVVYHFDDKGSKEEYHEEVCGGATKEGTVKGTVYEKDGKKYVKPSKVDYAKK
jgi:hypothetical protein